MARNSSTVGSNKSKVGSTKPKNRTTGAIKNPNQGGIGKAHIAAAGGGRAALLRWRALSKAERQAAIANNTVAQAAGVAKKPKTQTTSGQRPPTNETLKSKLESGKPAPVEMKRKRAGVGR